MRLPAETNRVVQVKYTNPNDPHGSFKCAFWCCPSGFVDTDMSASSPPGGRTPESAGKYAFDSEEDDSFLPASVVVIDASLSFSGSNQAREGRLVNALAVRGDEGRDTLR